MARTPITAKTITDTGYNLTDSVDFTTMTLGASNGVTFSQDSSQRIILLNDSGGAATYTVKIPTPTNYTSFSLTIPDLTISVANGKMYILEPHGVFRQPDGLIYIDCSVAGKILVLSA